jgi:hypothetical protein
MIIKDLKRKIFLWFHNLSRYKRRRIELLNIYYAEVVRTFNERQ